jgi:hypothetical protein
MDKKYTDPPISEWVSGDSITINDVKFTPREIDVMPIFVTVERELR